MGVYIKIEDIMVVWLFVVDTTVVLLFLSNV